MEKCFICARYINHNGVKGTVLLIHRHGLKTRTELSPLLLEAKQLLKRAVKVRSYCTRLYMNLRIKSCCFLLWLLIAASCFLGCNPYRASINSSIKLINAEDRQVIIRTDSVCYLIKKADGVLKVMQYEKDSDDRDVILELKEYQILDKKQEEDVLSTVESMGTLCKRAIHKNRRILLDSIVKDEEGGRIITMYCRNYLNNVEESVFIVSSEDANVSTIQYSLAGNSEFGKNCTIRFMPDPLPTLSSLMYQEDGSSAFLN